jgi:cytochrome c oxidase assembly protein Cox11
MRRGCKTLLYCDVIARKERRRKNTNKKEEKKVDLTKKITVTLTEDDIKELVAEYVKNNANLKEVTAENVEMVYGVKYSGPQMDRVEHGYLIECKVKC